MGSTWAGPPTGWPREEFLARSGRAPELVGRSAELGALHAALDRVQRGEGGTVVLLGEAGIGKSRLLREAEGLAVARGLRVLSGRAVERASPEPYRPLAEALARGLGVAGPPRDPQLLPVLGTLAHLVPAWSPRRVEQPPVVAVAEALLSLLEVTAATGPGTLLALEDLHWADAETLAVVEYVAEHLGSRRTVCLLTARPEPSGPARSVLRRLADVRAARLVEVPPLDRADCERLVLACLGEDAAPRELLDFVTDRADGVPFLVEELLAGLERCGALVAGEAGWQLVGSRLTPTVPATLAESIAARYHGLADRTQLTLSAAALLGRLFDWRLVAAVTGLEEDVVLASLREASYAGLVVGQGDGVRFRHALTRDHVLQLTLGPQRRRLAGLALRAVEDAHPGLPAHWCELAAELAEEAGRSPEAAASLLTAARRARDRGALASAGSRLERAMDRLRDGPPAPDGAAGHAAPMQAGRLALSVRDLLAEVRALAGDVDAAFALGEAALRELRARGDDPGREVDLELVLARAALAAGHYPEARAHAAAGGGRAGELADARRSLRAQALAAEVEVAAGDPERAERMAIDLLARTGDDMPEVRCTAYEVLGRCRRLHDVAAAERSFAAALALAERTGLVAWRARALHELGTVDLLDTLRTDRLTAARHAAVEAGAPATVAMVDFHLASVLLSRGQDAEGREAATRAATLSRRLGLALLPWALTIVARGWAQELRTAEMESVLAEVAMLAPGDPAVEAAVWSHPRAILALHRADRDAALAALDRSAELLRARPGQHDPHRGLWALLRTLADADAAAARTEVAASSGSGTRFTRALLLAAGAVDAGRRGEAAAASAGVARAVGVLDGYLGATWLTHLTSWLVAPAALRDGWGDPVGRLQDAVRWFGGHGYEPLATSCRVLLRDAGAAVPRQGRGTSTVPDRLRASGVTSREVDVLALLGQRLTNRQIAERLVLSPKTVEKHVGSLLLKTGAGSRAALAELAGRSGLVRGPATR